MKTLHTSLVFLVVVVSIEAVPISNMFRDRRGFKGPRFGHGYGKRTSDLITENETEHTKIPQKIQTKENTPYEISNDALAEVMVRYPSLAKFVVDTILDINDDGYISKNEIRSLLYRNGIEETDYKKSTLFNTR